MADYSSVHTGTEVDAAVTTVQDYVETYKAKMQYLSDVTSAIQAQIDGKQAAGSYVTTNSEQTISGVKTFSSAPIVSTLTASKILVSSATKEIESSSLVIEDLPTLAGENTFSVAGKNIFGSVAEFDNGVTKKLGFFGVTAVAKQSINADVSSTAASAVSSSPPAALTNSQGDTTTDGTLAPIGDTSSSNQAAPIERNISELNASINELRTICSDLKTELNKVITENVELRADLKAIGDVLNTYGIVTKP